MSDFNPNPHPPAGSTSSVHPEGSESKDAFDRSFYEKELGEARSEAARYRTQWAPFRDAFDGYGDEEKQEWFELATTLKQDPAAAAQRFRDLADQLAPAVEPPPVIPVPEAEPAAGDRPMTVAEFNRFQQEQYERSQQKQSEWQMEQQINGVYAQAEQLGYKQGTQDIVDLFWVAQNQTGADLAKAHEVLEARKEEHVREYLRSKGVDSRSLPIPSQSGGVPAAGGDSPRDFSSARASLEARLNQL